jgi:hypothetical protein
MKELKIICSRQSLRVQPTRRAPNKNTAMFSPVSDRASGFDRRSPDFPAFINDYDNMFINFLRPKGQLPFTVRRVHSLPVGYHERTKNYLFSLVSECATYPQGTKREHGFVILIRTSWIQLTSATKLEVER